MREVERIEDQLRRSCEGEAWHGSSLSELLAGVTADAAAARPFPNTHSIWELVLHVAAWQEAATEGIKGGPVQLDDSEDFPEVDDTSEEAWSVARVRLQSSMDELRKAILQLEDTDLSHPVSKKGYSTYYLLHGVVQHNIYHAGQIAILKKRVA